MIDSINIENEIRRLHKLRMLQQKISDEISRVEQPLFEMLNANEKELAKHGTLAVEIQLLQTKYNEREQQMKEVLAKVDLILDEHEKLLTDDEFFFDSEEI
jgi:hypothetical protein